MSILIVANPVSGRFSEQKLDKIYSILNNKFGKVNVALTKYRGNAREIAENATEDIIIAAGGDGLINETAGAMIGKNKIFSILPFGTANVFACEHNISRNPIKAAMDMKLTEPFQIPVGFIDDHHFLMMAGFGFDAATVERVHSGEKQCKYKNVAHVVHGAQVLLLNKFKPFLFYQMGVEKSAYHMIISLGKCYAGNFSLGEVKKNSLNVFYIDNNKLASLLKSIVSLGARLGFAGKRLTTDYIKLSGVSKCQVDGEFVDLKRSSAFVRVQKNAIKFAL